MPGTVTVTRTLRGLDRLRTQEVEVITASWTGDATDGSVPDTSLGRVRGTLLRLVTDPGTPAPTDNYDITVEDEDGFDVLGGAGANRDTAVTEEAEIKMTSFRRIVDNVLTFKLAGNIVVSAQGTARLYVLRGAG